MVFSPMRLDHRLVWGSEAMKLTIILAALLLQGCFYQSVNQRDFKEAARACGGFDNVFEIRAGFSGKEFGICKDGTKWSLQ
jgi:hypothetical protein